MFKVFSAIWTNLIRNQVKRSSCEVLFRFSNQGTLKASHALIVPVCGLWLKIAIVSGATPFLISNTFLRAVGALIDTQNHQLIIPNHQVQLPMQLTNKGLHLPDMHQLFQIAPCPGSLEKAAETYAQDVMLGEQKKAGEPFVPDDHGDQARTKEHQDQIPKVSENIMTCQSHLHQNPQSQDTSHAPVSSRNQSATSEISKFCPQNSCDPTSVFSASDHHERLESAPRQSASQLCTVDRS